MATPANTRPLWRFGVFELDTRRIELRRGGRRVKIREQSFRILVHLLEHAGEIVTREELCRVLWPTNTFVDFDHSLNAAVMKLREALGDSTGAPLYIETIPKRGYRFIAPATQAGESQSGLANSESLPVSSLSVKTMEQENGHEVRDEPAANGQTAADRGSSEPERVRAGMVPMLLGIAVPVLLLAVLFVTGGLYWRWRQAHYLTDKDTIVLCDFDNETGDAVFDDALKQGLSIQLEQTPFLELVSASRVSETLQFMGRSPGERLTERVAREVCQRTGSRVVLAGSITKLGSEYVIGLNAEDCVSGELLAEAQEQAGSKEQVLKALDRAAVSLRDKLGESRSSMEKYAVPLDQATTNSLDALKVFSLGLKAYIESGDITAGAALAQRAIDLDPNFAMAHCLLAATYIVRGENGLAAGSIRKAFELRDRVSQRERFIIEAFYSAYATGDLEKERQNDELWRQIFPRDDYPPAFLVNTDWALGKYDEALVESREAIRLDPTSGINYENLATSYFLLNRLSETRSTIEEAQAKKLDSPDLHILSYLLAFLGDNATEMNRQVAWGEGKPGVEDRLLAIEADIAAYSGRQAKARELSRLAVASAEQAEEKESAAGYETSAALREILLGDPAEGQKRIDAALKLSAGRDIEYRAALVLASTDDAGRAEALANVLSNRYPEDTIVQFKELPALHARLALSRSDASNAIEALRISSPLELGVAGNGEGGDASDLYPVYLRGEAYLAAREGSQAASEFNKIIDHRSINLNCVGALAHLGIARAYILQGDTVKGKAAYQDFLALWKDADPENSLLMQAKNEYAKLR